MLSYGDGDEDGDSSGDYGYGGGGTRIETGPGGGLHKRVVGPNWMGCMMGVFWGGRNLIDKLDQLISWCVDRLRG